MQGQDLDISITGWGLITPAGLGSEVAYQALLQQHSFVSPDPRVGGKYTASLPSPVLDQLLSLRQEHRLRDADISVLAAVSVVRQALQKFAIQNTEDTSIIVASSRGSQQSIEGSLQKYFQQDQLSLRNSPSTTFGRLASSVAQDIGSSAAAISVSSTCSSGLQAIGLAVAQLKSGMCEQAIVVASEFAITEFFTASLDRLSVYAKSKSAEDYIYMPFACDDKSQLIQKGMVLGEGAACLVLSSKPQQNKIKLSGFAANTDQTTATGVSKNALALQKSIRRAIETANISAQQVDAVVAHGSGNPLADSAEVAAYESFFDKQPYYTSYKYSLGHSLGASSLMAAVLAAISLDKGCLTSLPYLNILNPLNDHQEADILKPFNRLMVNALGFGGASSSIVLQK